MSHRRAPSRLDALLPREDVREAARGDRSKQVGMPSVGAYGARGDFHEICRVRLADYAPCSDAKRIIKAYPSDVVVTGSPPAWMSVITRAWVCLSSRASDRECSNTAVGCHGNRGRRRVANGTTSVPASGAAEVLSGFSQSQGRDHRSAFALCFAYRPDLGGTCATSTTAG